MTPPLSSAQFIERHEKRHHAVKFNCEEATRESTFNFDRGVSLVQSTPREQRLVLVRNYSEDDAHIELVTIFAIDEDIDREERLSCLRAIVNVAQNAELVGRVREMIRRLQLQ
ncbi:hypothetical protein H6CHR_01735 [Variovorax sp. PBL-H6]|uniref:hypothetical protein n=1 Tax=Variovorax sp. PBL-H6 TaxID=434009 RepID=UPI0013196482|nr:hypothetical protein [Variovorax sp. PBL-H6]VTU22167.1 hypothetical protein H6CHR_01735 [Variovorax sp. PBL-H6]